MPCVYCCVTFIVHYCVNVVLDCCVTCFSIIMIVMTKICQWCVYFFKFYKCCPHCLLLCSSASCFFNTNKHILIDKYFHTFSK